MKRMILIAALAIAGLANINAQSAYVEIASVPNEIYFNGDYTHTGSYVSITFWSAFMEYNVTVPFEGIGKLHRVPSPFGPQTMGCEVSLRVQTWLNPYVDPSYYGLAGKKLEGNLRDFNFRFDKSDFKVFML